MRTIEEVRQRLLDTIAGVASDQGYFCINERTAEMGFLQLLSDICWLDERESEFRSAIDTLERRRVLAPTGVSGGFRNPLPGLPDLVHEVTSVYAEVAYDLGYLSVTGLRSEPEWRSLTKGLRKTCRTRDFTLAETLATFGTPTKKFGSGLSHRGCTLCYAPASRSSRWIFFDVCSCQWNLARAEGRDECKIDPDLRNVRIPATTFSREITLTPHGRICPEAGGWKPAH